MTYEIKYSMASEIVMDISSFGRLSKLRVNNSGRMNSAKAPSLEAYIYFIEEYMKLK